MSPGRTHMEEARRVAEGHTKFVGELIRQLEAELRGER